MKEEKNVLLDYPNVKFIKHEISLLTVCTNLFIFITTFKAKNNY